MSKLFVRQWLKGLILSLALITPPVSDALEQRDTYEPQGNRQGLMELLENGWLKSTLDTAFLLNRNFRGIDIQVLVSHNSVTLTGRVDSAIKRSLAEEIARSIDGIHKVHNRLQIKASANQQNHQRQSSGPPPKDAALTAKISQRLRSNHHLQQTALAIHSQNGRVELSGNAPDHASRDLAYYLVKNIRGVKSVDNKIRVLAVGLP